MLSPADTLAAGTVLGSYRIVALRGTGAMGAVYEAVHTVLNKRAAVKIMHAGLLADPKQVQRFVREGQAAAAIRHPHVVQIFDVGDHDGRPFLIMEFLEGADLGHALREAGSFPPQRAADLLLPVISAVAAAHDSGVLHRDLKPDNIFLHRGLGGALQPTVVDFGISRINTAPQTATHAIVGSPSYMSPEQCQSRSGPESDQWALGIILHELCTGSVPFQSETIPGLLYQICHGAPPDPKRLRPDLPAALEAVILRALQRDPAARFLSVRELGGALLPFASAPVRERFAQELRVTPPTRQTPTVRWHRAALLGGATVLATVLSVLGLRHALSGPPARAALAAPPPAPKQALDNTPGVVPTIAATGTTGAPSGPSTAAAPAAQAVAAHSLEADSEDHRASPADRGSAARNSAAATTRRLCAAACPDQAAPAQAGPDQAAPEQPSPGQAAHDQGAALARQRLIVNEVAR